MQNQNIIPNGPEQRSGFTAYLNTAAAIPRLTREEEVQAGTIIQTRPGTPEAQEWHSRLVSANLRLVAKVAGKRNYSRVPFDELVSEGNLGLMEAADRYNPAAFGVRFSTYAVPWIENYMRLAIARARTIPLPVETEAKLSKVMGAPSFRPHGCEQDLSRLAQETRLRAIEIQRALETPHVSLQIATWGSGAEEDGLTVDPLYPADDPSEGLARAEELTMLFEAIGQCLDEREAKLLLAAFGINGPRQTQQELAEAHGLKRSTVGAILARAKEKLKAHLEHLIRASGGKEK